MVPASMWSSDMNDKTKDLPALLRRPQVQSITNLPTSTLYRDMSRGTFPRPVLLTGRAVAWRTSDIEQWLESRETSLGGYSKKRGASK